MALNDDLLRLTIALGILAAGYIGGQLFRRSLLRAYRTKRRFISIRIDRRLKATRYIINTVAIIAALVYLRVDAVEQLFSRTVELLPDILTAILLLVLGIIVVNFFIWLLERLLRTVGLVDYAGAYGKRQTVKLIFLGAQIFLYLVVVETTLSLVGVYSATLDTIIRIIIYAATGVFAILAFFGLRGVVENAFAGAQLKGINYLRQGQRLFIDDEYGEVTAVSSLATTVRTDAGYIRIFPHSELLKHNVKFESVKPEFKTLEEIQVHFVQQQPSYCGPACAQMILSILKYPKTDQEDIAKMCGTAVGKGTHPDALKRAIEEITHGEVIGHWVSVSKIVDLKQELRSWLHDGALVIVDFKKSVVFPTIDNDKAHYAVCVGMEGDDLILLDPSGPKGGVYLANHQDVHRGMNTFSKLINGKRGYLVVGKRGTTAYWRIKKGLVYADKDLYETISKQLEDQFDKVVSKSSVLKNVLPGPVREYLDDYEERYKIARLWRPSEK